jgi:hypothetical protein
VPPRNGLPAQPIGGVVAVPGHEGLSRPLAVVGLARRRRAARTSPRSANEPVGTAGGSVGRLPGSRTPELARRLRCTATRAGNPGPIALWSTARTNIPIEGDRAPLSHGGASTDQRPPAVDDSISTSRAMFALPACSARINSSQPRQDQIAGVLVRVPGEPARPGKRVGPLHLLLTHPDVLEPPWLHVRPHRWRGAEGLVVSRSKCDADALMAGVAERGA